MRTIYWKVNFICTILSDKTLFQPTFNQIVNFDTILNTRKKYFALKMTFKLKFIWNYIFKKAFFFFRVKNNTLNIRKLS